MERWILLSEIILDFGSGNTCKNSKDYIKRMIDELKEVDTRKHDVVIKWQLFESAGANIPLTRDSFIFAYEYALKHGYKTTASVFDIKSLEFLMRYEVPFIKIANNEDLYYLADYIPTTIPVYVSYKHKNNQLSGASVDLACVSQYPAMMSDYEEKFDKEELENAISDHTTSFELFNKYNPKIVEWHYKLDDSDGLDAGTFAKTPNDLREVL